MSKQKPIILIIAIISLVFLILAAVLHSRIFMYIGQTGVVVIAVLRWILK